MMRYVKTGLSGYGPDLDEYDSPAASTREVTDLIRDELARAIDQLIMYAPVLADQEDYAGAYGARVLADQLDVLAMNLDWSRRASAPLYAGDESALVDTMDSIIAESFPLDIDIDGHVRLYVWEADDDDIPEPDQWADSTDAYPYSDGR